MNEKAPLSFRLASASVSRLPRPLLTTTGLIGGFAFYILAREKRKNYLANTAIARSARRPPWKAFQNHTLNVLETLRAPSESGEEILSRIDFPGKAGIDEAMKRGKGLILVTCHFGNWELSGYALSRLGYPITTIAGEQFKPGWSEQIKQWKAISGIRVTSPGSRSRELFRDLAAKRIIVLHIDGNLFTGGIEIPFLGRTCRFPRGPARLARVTQAPIIFAYSRRTHRTRLEIHLDGLMEPPERKSEEADVTVALVRKLEKCVLAEPDQWCIFRKL